VSEVARNNFLLFGGLRERALNNAALAKLLPAKAGGWRAGKPPSADGPTAGGLPRRTLNL